MGHSIPGQIDYSVVVPSPDIMSPLESLYPRMEGLPWIHSIPGPKDSPEFVSQAVNDSPGVVVSQDRMTTLESFHPRTEILPRSRSTPGQNDSRGVVPPGLTPLESFHPMTEGVSWSRSIPGLKDSTGVVPSQDRMTPLESLYPRKE